MSNPFHTYVGLVERRAGFTDIQLRNDPDVQAWQIWGQKSLNGAYDTLATSGVTSTNPKALFTLTKGGFLRSVSVQRKGWGMVPESNRGCARAVFDHRDYITPGANQQLPTDEEWLFLRVQENRIAAGGLLTVAGAANTGKPKLGPIYCVPDPSFFGSSQPAFTLGGTAPSGTGCADGLVPVYDATVQTPLPMHIVFPRPAMALTVVNNEAAKRLLVSYGPGQSMRTVLAGGELPLFSGNIKEIIIASPDAGGAAFTIHGVVGFAAE